MGTAYVQKDDSGHVVPISDDQFLVMKYDEEHGPDESGTYAGAKPVEFVLPKNDKEATAIREARKGQKVSGR